MTTYEIIEQLRLIGTMREAVNETTGEFMFTDEEVEAEEEKINATKDQKLNAIQDYKLSLNDEITRFKEKKAKQDANIKRVTKQQDYLKELQCDLLGGEKLKTDEYSFYYTKSESVNIIDASFFNEYEEMITHKTEVNKTAVKKALKDGADFSKGAELIKKTSLTVR